MEGELALGLLGVVVAGADLLAVAVAVDPRRRGAQREGSVSLLLLLQLGGRPAKTWRGGEIRCVFDQGKQISSLYTVVRNTVQVKSRTARNRDSSDHERGN